MCQDSWMATGLVCLTEEEKIQNGQKTVNEGERGRRLKRARRLWSELQPTTLGLAKD